MLIDKFSKNYIILNSKKFLLIKYLIIIMEKNMDLI